VKASCILLLFLVSYHLFLRKETFFNGNRFFLIAGLLLSLGMPFITITKTIIVEPSPPVQSNFVALSDSTSKVPISEPFDWLYVLLIIYLMGLFFFGFRFIGQLLAIHKIKKNSDVIEEDHFYHVKTHRYISPFSFFKYIFYHPKQFKKDELHTILTHEKVHAREFHSVDILITELVCIVQWFNPAIWLYKLSVQQNLEFLADSKTCLRNQDKKFYQYLMLKQAVGKKEVTIANPFFNSIIKKRIVMLNQNRSKKRNLLKLFFIVPLLGLFLVGFNTREIVAFSEVTVNASTEDGLPPSFISPIEQVNIKKITSGFGPSKDPISKALKFHNGIDLQAPSGTDVMASAEGVVTVSSMGNLNGNYVIIEHRDGYSTKYMHLKDRSVHVGQKIVSSDIIGHVGNTGRSTGPHLHFEILKSNVPVNPKSLVAFKSMVIQRDTGKKDKTNRLYKKPIPQKKIELVINKKTTEEELETMKADLAKNDVDFSYTAVYNDKGEIIDISLQVMGKSKNGGTFNNSYNAADEKNAITPLVILIDPDNNLVSIGSKGTYKPKIIKTSGDRIQISVDDEEHRNITIKETDGVRKITVDGKEVSQEELEKMGFDVHEDKDIQIHVSSDHKTKTKGKHIEIKKHKHDDGTENVLIIRDSHDHSDIDVITDNDFFFIDTDRGKKPLFFIDGEKASRKDVKKLSPDDIETINVSKGEKTMEKYGKKAKDGVVEITTKNQR
ncbi:MAG: peptidoglycan DD-metalloendopeptidase family protein, partial [Bacteroidota bacterium]